MRAIVDVLREVAEGRLALFDPADLGDDFAGEARPVANAILERHRRLARAIVEAAG